MPEFSRLYDCWGATGTKPHSPALSRGELRLRIRHCDDAPGAAFGVHSTTGTLLMGLGVLGCTIWLLRFDVATRTIRTADRTWLFATAMLAGYFCLGRIGHRPARHWRSTVCL